MKTLSAVLICTLCLAGCSQKNYYGRNTTQPKPTVNRTTTVVQKPATQRTTYVRRTDPQTTSVTQVTNVNYNVTNEQQVTPAASPQVVIVEPVASHPSEAKPGREHAERMKAKPKSNNGYGNNKYKDKDNKNESHGNNKK